MIDKSLNSRFSLSNAAKVEGLVENDNNAYLVDVAVIDQRTLTSFCK